LLESRRDVHRVLGPNGLAEVIVGKALGLSGLPIFWSAAAIYSSLSRPPSISKEKRFAEKYADVLESLYDSTQHRGQDF
jgi:hypothetical protein